MTKIQFRRKCRFLFRKAHGLGLKLEFSPNRFIPERLNCLWYGGHLATIKVSDSLWIDLSIQGDVRAFLTDSHGDILEEAIDKNNAGAFSKYMISHLKTDRELKKALRTGRLMIGNNNWIEYDGIVFPNGAPDKAEVFIDLGLICDNVLDENILTAIGQTLDSVEEIKTEIKQIAERDYQIGGII